MNASDTVKEVLRAGREVDIEAFVALMAPDGYLEWPYRPPGVPERLTGRAAIHEHLTAVAGGFIRFDEFRDETIHETTDPEVVIVEYSAYGTVVPTGAPFAQQVIAVFRVRDGLVRSYRDYINPMPLIEARGSMEP